MNVPAESTNAEQRRSVRHSVHGNTTVDNTGKPTSDPRRCLAYIVQPDHANSILLARIVNISREGIGLHVGEPFQTGVTLNLVLRYGPVKHPTAATVIRVVEKDNGSWFVGLEFTQPIDDEILQPFIPEVPVTTTPRPRSVE